MVAVMVLKGEVPSCIIIIRQKILAHPHGGRSVECGQIQLPSQNRRSGHGRGNNDLIEIAFSIGQNARGNIGQTTAVKIRTEAQLRDDRRPHPAGHSWHRDKCPSRHRPHKPSGCKRPVDGLGIVIRLPLFHWLFVPP